VQYCVPAFNRLLNYNALVIKAFELKLKKKKNYSVSGSPSTISGIASESDSAVEETGKGFKGNGADNFSNTSFSMNGRSFRKNSFPAIASYLCSCWIARTILN
jgi:hypothetical protein